MKFLSTQDVNALNVLFESYDDAQFQVTITWVNGAFIVQAREFGQDTGTEQGIGQTIEEAVKNLEEK